MSTKGKFDPMHLNRAMRRSWVRLSKMFEDDPEGMSDHKLKQLARLTELGTKEEPIVASSEPSPTVEVDADDPATEEVTEPASPLGMPPGHISSFKSEAA